MTVGLIIAGGTGRRMGQDIPKQFLHIHDKPVIIYTLECFQRCDLVDGIVVSTLPGWIDFVKAYANQFHITKLRDVVAGGETGMESIHNGLMAVSRFAPQDAAVMVHDGIRPMVDEDILRDNLRVYHEKGNATTVIPCAEVMFHSPDPSKSDTVLNRDEIWRTQTPQSFQLGELLAAHAESHIRGLPPATASCSLYASLGKTVYFSKGSEKNVKLTTMDDIDIFKALLSAERSTWDQRKQ